MKNLMDLNILENSTIEHYLSELAQLAVSRQNELIEVLRNLNQVNGQINKIQENEAATQQVVAELKARLDSLAPEVKRNNSRSENHSDFNNKTLRQAGGNSQSTKRVAIYSNFEHYHYLEWDVKVGLMVNEGQQIACKSVSINKRNYVERSLFLSAMIKSPVRGLLSVIEFPSGSKLIGEKVLIGYITPID